jgi:hypothetical protein
MAGGATIHGQTLSSRGAAGQEGIAPGLSRMARTRCRRVHPRQVEREAAGRRATIPPPSRSNR